MKNEDKDVKTTVAAPARRRSVQSHRLVGPIAAQTGTAVAIFLAGRTYWYVGDIGAGIVMAASAIVFISVLYMVIAILTCTRSKRTHSLAISQMLLHLGTTWTAAIGGLAAYATYVSGSPMLGIFLFALAVAVPAAMTFVHVFAA